MGRIILQSPVHEITKEQNESISNICILDSLFLDKLDRVEDQSLGFGDGFSAKLFHEFVNRGGNIPALKVDPILYTFAILYNVNLIFRSIWNQISIQTYWMN